MPPKKRTANQPRKSRRAPRVHVDDHAEQAHQAREARQATASSLGDLHLFRPWSFNKTAADQITAIQNEIGAIATSLGAQATHPDLFRTQLTILGTDSFDRIRQNNDGSYNPDNDRTFQRPLHAAICKSIGNTAAKKDLTIKCEEISFRRNYDEMKVVALLGGVAQDEVTKVHNAINTICRQKLFDTPPQPFVTLSEIPLGVYKQNVAAFSPIQSMELGALTFGAMCTPANYEPIRSLK